MEIPFEGPVFNSTQQTYREYDLEVQVKELKSCIKMLLDTEDFSDFATIVLRHAIGEVV